MSVYQSEIYGYQLYARFSLLTAIYQTCTATMLSISSITLKGKCSSRQCNWYLTSSLPICMYVKRKHIYIHHYLTSFNIHNSILHQRGSAFVTCYCSNTVGSTNSVIYLIVLNKLNTSAGDIIWFIFTHASCTDYQSFPFRISLLYLYLIVNQW